MVAFLCLFFLTFIFFCLSCYNTQQLLVLLHAVFLSLFLKNNANGTFLCGKFSVFCFFYKFALLKNEKYFLSLCMQF